MKNLKYLSIMLLACLMQISCLGEYDAPCNLPTVTTYTASAIGTRWVTLSGYVSNSSNTWFRLSTSKDLSDAKYINTYNRYGTINCKVESLQPATTYYYALCASDGYSTITGNVESFTTGDCFGFRSIYMNPLDGSEKKQLTEGAIGTFLYYGNSSYPVIKNMYSAYSGSRWIPESSIDYISYDKMIAYSYYPYSKSYEYNSYTQEITVPVYCPSNNKEEIDYLYSQYVHNVDDDTQLDMMMYHAMSRIVLSITKASDSKLSGTVKEVELYDESYNRLYSNGEMNVKTGNISYTKHSKEYYINCNITPQVDKSITVERLMFPANFTDNQIRIGINIGGYYYYTYLPATYWKKGTTYTYPIEIGNNKITIGTVQITPWDNQYQGGLEIENDNLVQQ